MRRSKDWANGGVKGLAGEYFAGPILETQDFWRTVSVVPTNPGLSSAIDRNVTEESSFTLMSTLNSPESDPWVVRLKSDQATRDAALQELSDFLVRGLRKSMATRYNACLQPEDVVQEALIKILASLDQFAGRSRFTTWAMTVATRIAISEMRRKHYQDVSMESFKTDDSKWLEVAVDESAGSNAEIDRKEMVGMLQRLIDEQLTEKQRTAIRGSLAGLPVEVIAEKLGSNRNTIYKLVHDARVKLKAGLQAAGIAADDFAATFA